MNEDRLILTCGLPGAGKTRLAKELAAERDELRTAARDLGVGVELHYLDVQIDELWRRIDARNSAQPWDSGPITRAHLDDWHAVFEAPDAAELALFDAAPP